jgi:putative nucleotidyltransferase with HDIG domain
MAPPVITLQDLAAVKKALPEIDLLEDSEIKEKVARIWAMAWRESTWGKLEDACFAPDISGASLVDHVRVTAQGSMALAEIIEQIQGIKIDRQRLLLLALLHDVSKLVEYEDGRKTDMGQLIQHGFYGAHLALNEGFPLEIVHEILTHTPQSKMRPNFLEGILLAHIDYGDADLIHFTQGKKEKLLL